MAFEKFQRMKKNVATTQINATTTSEAFANFGSIFMSFSDKIVK